MSISLPLKPLGMQGMDWSKMSPDRFWPPLAESSIGLISPNTAEIISFSLTFMEESGIGLW